MIQINLNEIIKIYNETINFEYYYKILFPTDNLYKPLKCRLHREETGTSFSYSPILKVWTCFGKCHTSGKVVEFHKRYTNKNIYQTLEELRDMFPLLNLPEPNTYITNNTSVDSLKQKFKDISKPNNKILINSNEDTLDNLIENMFFLKKEE